MASLLAQWPACLSSSKKNHVESRSLNNSLYEAFKAYIIVSKSEEYFNSPMVILSYLREILYEFILCPLFNVLFTSSIASDQIMYGYAMRPSSIDPSFYKFIQSTGPIPERVLMLLRQNLHDKTSLDSSAVVEAVRKGNGTSRAFEVVTAMADSPDVIPCALLHPHVDSCNTQFGNVFKKVFWKILPV